MEFLFKVLKIFYVWFQWWFSYLYIRCCSSVAQSGLTLCDPMDCSTLGPSVPHYLSELALTCMESVMPSNHLILCHFFFLLPSIFPRIRVFSNELALHVKWPKYWSFSLSISPSSEYSVLISFRTDWFGLLSVYMCTYNENLWIAQLNCVICDIFQ